MARSAVIAAGLAVLGGFGVDGIAVHEGGFFVRVVRVEGRAGGGEVPAAGGGEDGCRGSAGAGAGAGG